MTGDVWLRTGPRIFARTDHRPFRSKLGISRALHLQSPRYLAPPLEPAYAWNYPFLLAASSALAQLAEENPTCRTTARRGRRLARFFRGCRPSGESSRHPT